VSFDSTTLKLPDIQVVPIIGLPVAATSYAGAIDWIKAAALIADHLCKRYFTYNSLLWSA